MSICEKNNEVTELDVCDYFIDYLSKTKEKSLFKIEQRSQDYVSLVYGNNDFLRVKYTSNTKWISIYICRDDVEKNKNNPLFEAQKNKKQLHWKAKIEKFEDLSNFLAFAEKACFIQKVAGDEDLTNEERIVADYIRNIFIELGANENKIKLN